MINIENLSKVYSNGKKALNGLSLQIEEGMFGLVGPNGAGKTTLMRILATLLRPTAGCVSVYGHSLDTPQGRAYVRSVLGYLPQEVGFHLRLTVEQELDYMAILKNITDPKERGREIDRVLEHVGLEHVRRERVHALSGGMKRRLGIGMALLGNPRLIIVDEPTANLDPAERVRFRNLLFRLAGDRVVILATHIIEDVNQICSDLAVIRDGVLLFCGPPHQLTSRVEGRVWLVPDSELVDEDRVSLISSRTTERGVEHRVLSEENPSPTAHPISPTLEDAYLWLVRKTGGGPYPTAQSAVGLLW